MAIILPIFTVLLNYITKIKNSWISFQYFICSPQLNLKKIKLILHIYGHLKQYQIEYLRIHLQNHSSKVPLDKNFHC